MVEVPNRANTAKHSLLEERYEKTARCCWKSPRVLVCFWTLPKLCIHTFKPHENVLLTTKPLQLGPWLRCHLVCTVAVPCMTLIAAS